MSNYRTRIIEIAYNELGKRGPYVNEALWCGHFVCWVLREAGLKVTVSEDRPGQRLCECLDWTYTPQSGDIVRYPNAHCGIIVDTKLVISGGMKGDSVKLERLRHIGRAFSIDELIRRAEMSGAETGELL